MQPIPTAPPWAARAEPHKRALPYSTQHQPSEPHHPQQTAFARVHTSQIHPHELLQQNHLPHTEPQPEAGWLLATTCIKPLFAPSQYTPVPALAMQELETSPSATTAKIPARTPVPSRYTAKLPRGHSQLEQPHLNPTARVSHQHRLPAAGPCPSWPLSQCHPGEGEPLTESTCEPRATESQRAPLKTI